MVLFLHRLNGNKACINKAYCHAELAVSDQH